MRTMVALGIRLQGWHKNPIIVCWMQFLLKSTRGGFFWRSAQILFSGIGIVCSPLIFLLLLHYFHSSQKTVGWKARLFLWVHPLCVCVFCLTSSSCWLFQPRDHSRPQCSDIYFLPVCCIIIPPLCAPYVGLVELCTHKRTTMLLVTSFWQKSFCLSIWNASSSCCGCPRLPLTFEDGTTLMNCKAE